MQYRKYGKDGPEVSRLGFGVSVGRYRVAINRDGGVNGFGATWAFAMTALFR